MVFSKIGLTVNEQDPMTKILGYAVDAFMADLSIATFEDLKLAFSKWLSTLKMARMNKLFAAENDSFHFVRMNGGRHIMYDELWARFKITLIWKAWMIRDQRSYVFAMYCLNECLEWQDEQYDVEFDKDVLEAEDEEYDPSEDDD